MEMHANTEQYSNMCVEERSSHELLKRILKARWIGRTRDADQVLLAALGRRGPGLHNFDDVVEAAAIL